MNIFCIIFFLLFLCLMRTHAHAHRSSLVCLYWPAHSQPSASRAASVFSGFTINLSHCVCVFVCVLLESPNSISFFGKACRGTFLCFVPVCLCCPVFQSLALRLFVVFSPPHLIQMPLGQLLNIPPSPTFCCCCWQIWIMTLLNKIFRLFYPRLLLTLRARKQLKD